MKSQEGTNKHEDRNQQTLIMQKSLVEQSLLPFFLLFIISLFVIVGQSHCCGKKEGLAHSRRSSPGWAGGAKSTHPLFRCLAGCTLITGNTEILHL